MVLNFPLSPNFASDQLTHHLQIVQRMNRVHMITKTQLINDVCNVQKHKNRHRRQIDEIDAAQNSFHHVPKTAEFRNFLTKPGAI